MHLLRLIGCSVYVLGFCGCATTTIDFDDHLVEQPQYKSFEAPPGFKTQQQQRRTQQRKLHRVYTREKLDVRLDTSLATLQESGSYDIWSGVFNVKNLLGKLFTNNKDSQYLLQLKQSDLSFGFDRGRTYAGGTIALGGYFGEYNLIVTLTYGDKTEIIRVEKTGFSTSSTLGAKSAIEQVLDELYTIVSIHLESWENK